jgi:hypothetical protein
MGTVTQYNLANVQAALGGANPISMSEYYRGGPYVPVNRTVGYTAREPASGDTFITYPNTTDWAETSDGYYVVRWYGTQIFTGFVGPTSYTRSGVTYFRGTYRFQSTGSKSNVVTYFYGIYRTYPSSYQQAINTGVPSSGTISISQLYGAANP